MRLIAGHTCSFLLVACAIGAMTFVHAIDVQASSLKQRVPLQQKNLRNDVLKPKIETPAPKPTQSGDERARAEEAQLLYNFYRNRDSMPHEEAIKVLQDAGYPTAGIVAK